MSAPEWDEEHEHTDAELMALWMKDVLGVELAPWQRVWLNEVVQGQPRVRVLRDVEIVEVLPVLGPNMWGGSAEIRPGDRGPS